MTTHTETVRGWFTGRLPQEWFTGPVEVTVDREEILVVGPLAAPETGEGVSDAERSAAVDGRIKALPRGHPRPAHRDRPRGRAPLRAQGGLGRRVRRPAGPVHPPVRAGDDPAAPARAPGARHPGRGRRRPVAVRGAGLGGAAGRSAQRGLAARAARGDGAGAAGARAGARSRPATRPDRVGSSSATSLAIGSATARCSSGATRLRSLTATRLVA